MGSDNVLPDKLGQILVSCIVGAPSILALVHRPVHARLKESSCMGVYTACDEFVKLVIIALNIPPYECWFAFSFSGTKFELFADQEHTLLIGCGDPDTLGTTRPQLG